MRIIKITVIVLALACAVYPQQCNSAQWNARCSVITQAECVGGGPNEGCLVVGTNCTNCYRGDPERAVQPPPKKKPKRVYKPRWVTGKFVAGSGWVVESPGAWAKKGLKPGDVIFNFNGEDITDLKTFMKWLVNLHKVEKYKVRQVREVAAR